MEAWANMENKIIDVYEDTLHGFELNCDDTLDAALLLLKQLLPGRTSFKAVVKSFVVYCKVISFHFILAKQNL